MIRLHPLLFVWLASASIAHADLAGELTARLRQAKGTEFSVQVLDAGSGEVLFEYQADRRLVPASNMKVLTTAAALDLLGPDYEHQTRLLVTSAPVNGVVKGDLVIVGGGDPTLSRRFDSEPLLSDWAKAVYESGIRRIEGDVIADARAFDSVALHPTWEDSDQEHWYGAEVSALSLNDNCLDVRVAGGETSVTVTSSPETAYVRFDLQAKLLSSQKGHSFSLQRLGSDKRTIRVSGKVWRKAAPYESSIPMRDPPGFFATVLAEQLVLQGVELAGVVRHAAPEERFEGLTVQLRKAPLARTLTTTNQLSLNLYAECLFKTLGREKGEGGTWPAGSAVVTRWVQEQGVAADDLHVLDGSGLSRENGLTARALTAVLRAALTGLHGELFRESLARPGSEGTLRRRLKSLPEGVELRAKTGTLRNVSALSGSLKNGERELIFSAIGNGGGGGQIKRAIDAVVIRLAEDLR